MNTEKDFIPGGLADDHTPSTIADLHGVELSQIEDQLKKGMSVELEHTDDEKLAREIAMDHLVEDPRYYDKLETIEESKLKDFNAFLSEEGEAFATVDSVPGMGEPVIASRGVTGSGDVPSITRKKKKVISFEEFHKNKK